LEVGVRDGNRAAVSAALLVGFLVVAWLQVLAALLVVLLVLALLPGSAAVRVTVPLAVATGGLLWYATARALRLRRPSPAGVAVTRQDAPALWGMIDAAATAAGVRPPDGVTVVAGATATLAEHPRLAGLLGGRRELYLGLPLLQAWDEPRLRAAVAHELAHGTPRLGWFAPMAYRGRLALGRIVPRIPRRSPAGPLLRAYARWARRVDAPFGREQELAADRIAAEFAGARPAAEVPRDGPALEGMQQLFYTEYLSPGWQAGYVPDDVFGGLLRVLAARADDMAVLRAQDPEPPGEWDAHPPPADRLAALADLITEGPEPAERPPAGDLVPDLPALGRALQAVAFPPAGRAVVGWDEFFGAARTAEMEREADASLRAISRVAGTPVAGTTDVLDLAADGRLRKIAETVFDDLPADETAGRVTDLICLLLALAALHSGVARWRHSWMGTAELVAIDGSHLDLGGLAALAADPATVVEARQHVAALGIDLAATGTADRPPARVPVIGGVVNVLVDGVRTDLLIVETGLFLVPGLPRSRTGEAKRRLNRLAADGVLADGTPAVPATGHAEATATAVAAAQVTGAPGSATPGLATPATPSAGSTAGEAAASARRASRFVPFADVAGASVSRNGRRSWEMNLRDGGTLSVRTALDSDELPGGWTALDDAVAFLASTR
jgi:Zn-dependent protease with chaperone function